MTTFIFPDLVRGTTGNDVIDVHEFGTFNYGFHVFGQAGDDVIYGSPLADGLNGQRGEDRLYGGYGIDTLGGFEGNDIIDGGPGDDEMFGGRGHDQIYGGDGHDIMFGGRGNDFINGGDGINNALAGPGNDTVVFGTGWAELGGGHDNAILSSGYVETGRGRDTVTVLVIVDGIAATVEINDVTALDRVNVNLHGQAFNLASLDLNFDKRLDAADGALLGDSGDVRLGDGRNGLTFSFRDGEVWDEISFPTVALPTDFIL